MTPLINNFCGVYANLSFTHSNLITLSRLKLNNSRFARGSAKLPRSQLKRKYCTEGNTYLYQHRQLEGKWTHVVLTFNAESGAHVYFDGQSQGVRRTYTMRSPILPKPQADYQLFYGKDNYGGARGKLRHLIQCGDKRISC